MSFSIPEAENFPADNFPAENFQADTSSVDTIGHDPSQPDGATPTPALNPSNKVGNKPQAPSTEYLNLRKGWYQFVRRYPADLIDAGIFKKLFYRRSLRTKVKKEAQIQARRLAVRFDETMAKLRQRLLARNPAAFGAAPSADSRTVKPCDIPHLASRFEALLLHTDDLDRKDKMSRDELQTYREEIDAERRDLVADSVCSDFDAYQEVVAGFVGAEQLQMPSDEELASQLARALMQAHLKALSAVSKRLQGEIVVTPQNVVPVRSEHDLDDMWRAFDYWVSKSKPGAKTAGEVRPVWQRLQDFSGKTRLSTLTREDLVGFQASELSRQTNRKQAVRPQTVNKHFGLMAAIATLAYDDVLKPRGHQNPFEHFRKAKVRASDRVDKLDLSQEELVTLFSGPVHTQGYRPAGGAGEASYWLPILGHATGARMSELAQLRTTEVLVRDGVVVLWLTTSQDDKSAEEVPAEKKEQALANSVKTGQSRRLVPVHPDVLALGFMDYVQSVRSQGHGRLFPYVRPDCHGVYGGNFSKFYNRYLARVGIKRPGLDWISFRHTFKSAGRAVGMPSDMLDYIQGHASERVSQDYGRFPPKAVLENMSRMELPALKCVTPWKDRNKVATKAQSKAQEGGR